MTEFMQFEMQSKMKRLKKLTILSSFSGAGGMDLGFECSGKFKTLACIESNKTYASTLMQNKGKIILGTSFLKDSHIENSTVGDFIKGASKHPWIADIDGIIGGPPCQPFSTIGKRLGKDDPRASTLTDYIELIRIIRPSFFLFENVPNLAWQWSGKVLLELTEALSFNDEYKIESMVVNAADYGAFTKRKRLILIGIKRAKLADTSSAFFPIKTHIPQVDYSSLKHGWRTTGDALIDIPSPRTTREDTPTHHVAVNHTTAVIERFRKLKAGEQCKIRKRWRLDLNQPSNSLMAGGDGGYVFHIHPTEPRELTSRECARLQGFPDNFDFCGKPLDVAKQIVNAVPIQLATAMANAVYGLIRN